MTIGLVRLGRSVEWVSALPANPLGEVVRNRTREVGVRMALGAKPADVLRMVLAQGGKLAAAGITAGAAAAALVGRVLESLLYGVSSMDPMAYAAAAAVLLAVAAIANLAPALGAMRIDPLKALRSE